MASGNDWLPSRLADLAEMFLNIKGKISGYTPILPITAAQQTEIILICNQFIGIYNYVVQCQATTEALVGWRDVVLNGQPAGTPAPPPPVYPTFTAIIGSVMGILIRFRDLVDIIKSSPAYTHAIGEDLMIVAVKKDKPVEADVTPNPKVITAPGYVVQVSGSLQGQDAMRVEYEKNGTSTWNNVAFITKLPGEFTVSPTAAGTPEMGRIRFIFIKDNQAFGNFSLDYPVTLS